MENKELKTVYITKYALTKGILEYPGELYTSQSYTYWKCYSQTFPNAYETFMYKDGWLSKEDAIDAAEQQRIAKLKALNKQIEKISKLKFE